jgi:hypothetical protein
MLHSPHFHFHSLSMHLSIINSSSVHQIESNTHTFAMPPTKRHIVTASTANGIKRRRAAGDNVVRVGSGTGVGVGGAARPSPVPSSSSFTAASASSTTTTTTNQQLNDEFIRLLSNPQHKNKGIANSSLKSHFGSQYPDLVPIINELTRTSRLTMSKLTSSKTGESEVYFSLLSVEEASKLRGLDASSKMVYQVIEAAGNKGIWTVDVRVQTNIQQATLTKIFKVSEERAMSTHRIR